MWTEKWKNPEKMQSADIVEIYNVLAFWHITNNITAVSKTNNNNNKQQ